MKITEQKIETIIYESPWLLDERFVIPNISGSEGEYGRQINIGKDNSRFIDLLFKDTRDNRPVIIELKKGKIIRENIAQTLEYRALITSLNEESKDTWETEFGQNYYAPKMILIGNEADEDTILSANLAGIEIRTFKTEYDSEIGFDSFKELKTKLEEWNNFRRSGNRTLIERGDWIMKIYEDITTILNKEFKEKVTLKKPYYITGKRNYIHQFFPFLNMPIFYEEEEIIGIYEYFDEELPFDDKYIYCDFFFLYENKKSEKVNNEIIALAKKRMNKAGFELINYTEDKIPFIKIPRNIFEIESELRKSIKSIVKLAIDIFEKF
jgi:hypothetical protein